MSFSNKVNSFLENFKLTLNDPPPRDQIYLYADFVELIALFSGQNYVSTSDILDRLRDEGGQKQVDDTKFQAEENDRQEIHVSNIFKLINERAILFGDDYPFLIVNNNKIILKENSEITVKNMIYIYLLICSSLNNFSEFQSILTSEFEVLSYYVLANYLPKHAVVKSFGKRPDYNGTARKKIHDLAKDMKVRLDEESYEEISVKGTQEKGLDLVGWIPFADDVPNFITIMGQCACGKDWISKLHETSRYNNFMRFHRLNPIHSMFIPYSLVSLQKKTFDRSSDITERLVFERKRILNYLIDIDFFNNFESKILVENCICFTEDIV